MVKKRGKSKFMDRVRDAHEEHKGDETRVGSGGDLPGGIEGGIARLSMMQIGTFQRGDNEGEPFFMAAGTVLEPTSHSVVDPLTKKVRILPIYGLRTQVGPEPLCDTVSQKGNETSLADHWDRVLNHLRLLGVDTKDIDPEEIILEGPEGYESGPLLEDLVSAKPTFRFRTWQGKPSQDYPDPRVNHEWRGICEYDEEEGEDVEEREGDKSEWESEEEETAEDTTEEGDQDVDLEDEEEADWLALGKAADEEEDADAAATLTDKADSLGIENYEDMPSWTEVAEAIIEASAPPGDEEEGEEEEEEEEEEDWVPAKGETVFYKPPRAKKPVNAKVMMVSEKNETCSVKRGDTGKVVKGVSFDKLSPFTEDDIPF